MTWEMYGLAVLLCVALSIVFSSQRFAKFFRGPVAIQDVHFTSTSRLGGLSICASFILILLLFPNLHLDPTSQKMVLYSTYAGILGFIDDVKGHVSQYLRFFVLIVICFFTVQNTGVLIRVDLIYEYVSNQLHLLILCFTIFALVGVTNSFNLIDGLDGIASGIGIVILSSMAALAMFVGDQEVSQLLLILATVIFGFFMVNFVTGKIFLGDSGAYFLGLLIAQTAVYLNNFHESITSWSMLLICAYPIWDTCACILRRKKNLFLADKYHLHHLILAYLNRTSFRLKISQRRLNQLASSLCITLGALPAVLSLYYWHSSAISAGLCALVFALYSGVYLTLTKILTSPSG